MITLTLTADSGSTYSGLFTVPQNNPVTATLTFVDMNGDPFDPVSGIEILIRDSNGSITTYVYSPGTIVKSASGIYAVTFEVTAEGSYVGRGQGVTSSGVETSPDTLFSVTPTQI